MMNYGNSATSIAGITTAQKIYRMQLSGRPAFIGRHLVDIAARHSPVHVAVKGSLQFGHALPARLRARQKRQAVPDAHCPPIQFPSNIYRQFSCAHDTNECYRLVPHCVKGIAPSSG